MSERKKLGRDCKEKLIFRANNNSSKADCRKGKQGTLVFILFSLLFSSVASGGELLANGNFKDVENGRPRGWRIRGDTAVVCGEESCEDSNALRLPVVPEGYATCVSPPIKVETGKRYRIRWRCRTADFKGARAYVFLLIGNRQQTLPSATAADAEKRRMLSMRGNGDWTEFETSYRPGEEENEFRVVLTTHDEKGADTTRAAAWFADVSVTWQATDPLTQNEDDTVALKNDFISATFNKSSNFVLSDLFIEKESFINTISPSFHYQGTSEHQEYYSSVANAPEFGGISDENEQQFRVVEKIKNDKTFTVFTEDRYMKIEQEARLWENKPVLELKYKFAAKERVLLKFWTFLPSVRFSSTQFKWIYPSLEIKNGIVAMGHAEKMSENFSRRYQNSPLDAKLNYWFAAKSLSGDDGIIFLMPNDRARFFIQNQKAYLAISSSFTDDILLQKGQTGEVKFYIVHFNGDFESSLKYWCAKFDIPYANSPRLPISPTGRLLGKTDDFIIWSDILDRDILRHEPAPTEEAAKVKIDMAKNETEAFQLVIRGRKDMNCPRTEGLTLRFTPLKQKNSGIEIPTENVSFHIQEYIKLLHGRKGENPDMLVTQNSFYVSPNENRVLCVKIRTDVNTSAGKYSGNAELYQGKTKLADIALSVKVRDFVVPESKNLGLWLVPALRHSLYRIYPRQEANRLYAKYVDNIIKHRASFQNASINVSFKPESAIPEGMNFDFFKKQLDECFNLLGMKMVNCRIFGIGASARLKKTPYGGTEDIFSALWTERYRKTAEQMRDFLKENNWQKKVCFEMFDEPQTADIENIRKAGKILKEVFPEIQLTYWGPPDERLLGIIDIWVSAWGLSHSPSFANERRKEGEQIWHYNPPYGAIDKGENMRYIFWSAWVNNLDGVYMWQTTNWFNWDKLTRGRESNNGASWFYPGNDGPIDTLRWERMREGLEDYEYFHMLRKAIDKAKEQKLSPEAENAVEIGVAALSEMGSLFIEGTLRPKRNFDHVKMYDIRERVMQSLENLHNLSLKK